MGGFDMHIHTTASDGLWQVDEILRQAQAIGLDGVAITDHDTVSALPEAMLLSKQIGFPVISGIELSTEFDGKDIHILGYWLNYEDKDLLTRLAELQEQRINRACQMAQVLDDLGMPINLAAVLEEAGASVGRPHLARALVKEGYVRTEREAFMRYLLRGKPAYVPRVKFSPFEALDLLRENGAACVVAHPGTGAPDKLLEDLAARGIDGLEVYHPEHDRRKEYHYLKMVKRLRLVVTGGSDFHGKPEVPIGCKTIPLVQLEMLARSRMTKRSNLGI